MDENYKMDICCDDNNEDVLDYRDMTAELIRKLPLALLFGIVFALLIGTYRYVTASKEQEMKYSDEALESILNELTQDSINNVEELFNRYESYQKTRALNDSYLRDSYIMRLNPESVYILREQYLLESDYSNIYSSFAGMALSQEDYRKIAAVFSDVNEKYSYEAVSVLGASGDDLYSVAIDNGDDKYVGEITRQYKSLLTISITAQSKEQCEQIKSIVSAAIERHRQVLIDAGAQVNLREIGSNYLERASDTIASQQQERISNNSTLIAEYKDFEERYIATLSAQEKDYFSFLVHRYDHVEEGKHVARYVVIGGIIGLLLPLVFYGIKYLMSSTIKTEDEISLIVGLDPMTLLRREHRKNKVINRIADDIAYGRENSIPWRQALSVQKARLEYLCKRRGINSLFIIANQQDSFMMDVIEQLQAMADIKTSFGEPMQSVDAMKGLADADGCLILISLKHTLKKETNSCLAICDENSIPVIGSITLT